MRHIECAHRDHCRVVHMTLDIASHQPISAIRVSWCVTKFCFGSQIQTNFVVLGGNLPIPTWTSLSWWLHPVWLRKTSPEPGSDIVHQVPSSRTLFVGNCLKYGMNAEWIKSQHIKPNQSQYYGFHLWDWSFSHQSGVLNLVLDQMHPQKTEEREFYHWRWTPGTLCEQLSV